MTTEEYTLDAIRMKTDYILSEIEKLASASKKAEEDKEQLPEFVTLAKAAELKGGASLNTYKSRFYLQPCGGTRSVKVGGRKCWARQDVLDWLPVSDDKLPEYLRQFGVEAKL